MSKQKTITIDEVEYVRKDSVENNAPSESLDGKQYAVIRSRDSGYGSGGGEKG